MFVSSRVRTSEVRRSAQKRSGFRSIKVSSRRWLRKEGGVSEMTCRTFIRVFRYSMKRLRKATKCSARRMFPGTASLRRSSGNAGFAMKAFSSRASSAARKSFDEFCVFVLQFLGVCGFHFLDLYYLDCWLLVTLALRSESSVMSILRDSMHTLSMLWASSNTTMQSLESSLDTRSAILGSRR